MLLVEHSDGQPDIAQEVMQVLIKSRAWVDMFRRTPALVDYDDATTVAVETGSSPSQAILQRKVLVLVLMCTDRLQAASRTDVVLDLCLHVETQLYSVFGVSVSALEVRRWVFQLCREQDDVLICVLHLLAGLHARLLPSPDTVRASAMLQHAMAELDIHAVFVQLGQTVAFDHLVLLDWLMSNETDFLPYLLA